MVRANTGSCEVGAERSALLNAETLDNSLYLPFNCTLSRRCLNSKFQQLLNSGVAPTNWK